MKMQMKRIVSFLAGLAILISQMPTLAVDISKNDVQLYTSDGDSITVTEQEYDELVAISEDDAGEIALLFVQDAIDFGEVEWDENTYVTDITCMYDESGSGEITAYTVELNEGYVVVLADMDTEILIPEWSDKEEPLYENFDIGNGDQILYLGAYEYYLESDNSGDYVESLAGENVNRDDLVNDVTEWRSADNIPTEIIDEYIESQSATIMSGDDDSGISLTSGVISNAGEHANSTYQGPFILSDYVNKWDNYMGYYTTSYGSSIGYTNHCGPTAITNLILACGNRYPSKISYSSANTVFKNVVTVGLNNNYYSTGSGTANSTALQYIRNSFALYSAYPTLYGNNSVTYNNIVYALTNEALLYVMLSNHETYGNHAVVCFAYCRLVSETTGWYKTYMKVADGWGSSGRYIDLGSALTAKYVSVNLS